MLDMVCRKFTALQHNGDASVNEAHRWDTLSVSCHNRCIMSVRFDPLVFIIGAVRVFGKISHNMGYTFCLLSL